MRLWWPGIEGDPAQASQRRDEHPQMRWISEKTAGEAAVDSAAVDSAVVQHWEHVWTRPQCVLGYACIPQESI